ncbi:IS66 family insertion sequence element accessory protein TnpB [Vibrio parahaemolyticus]|nr:IS66 family insertion sequence element accessory protein TnpB [Vibrio parahaemolyticus]
MRQPILRPSLSLPKVYLYRDPIDFRKSHRGLSALVELELGHNPFSGELYVFTNSATKSNACSGRTTASCSTISLSLKKSSSGQSAPMNSLPSLVSK